jgi:hypothetical protein
MRTRKIVYFVGAGLTKALERPGKPVPLMNDFIHVMAERIEEDKDNVILGTLALLVSAGVFEHDCTEASRIIRSHTNFYEWTPEERVAFRLAMMDRPPESIERLLENALEEAPHDMSAPSATRLVIAFIYAINRFFSLLGWEVEWGALEGFLRHQFARYPLESHTHTFVSFNYDLILDRKVQELARDAHHPGVPSWHPSTGYGFNISYYLPLYAKLGTRTDSKSLPRLPCVGVSILKPHGSLNWLVPQVNSGRTGDIGYLLKDGPVSTPLGKDGEIGYPRFIVPTGVYPLGSLAVCIVPPTDPAKRVTLGFIERTRCMERKAIEEADEVYILGWSMPTSDKDQRLLIAQAIAERERPISQVVAVNKRAGEDYFDDVRQLFGTVNVTKHNNGFCEFAGGL